MQKKFYFLSVSILCLVSLNVFAARYKSENAVHAKFDPAKRQINVTIDKGFHVNDKAPNKVTLLPSRQVIQANKVEKQTLAFELPPDFKSSEEVRVSAYVCDDAVTVCEQRDWSWQTNGQVLASRGAQPATPAAETKVLRQEFGFYMDNLSIALSEAKARKKPVLLVFSARWCPGCLRMDREVWKHSSMRPTLSKFIKVKLDADRFENKLQMEKYGVAAIPAILILNGDGEELERFMDYQERTKFDQSLQALLKKDLPPRSQLVAKAEKGDVEAATILAVRAGSAYKVDEALKWFEKVPTRETHIEYWWSKLSDLDAKDKDPKTKKERLEGYQKAVSAFSRIPSSLSWRQTIAELQGETTVDGKKTLNEILTLTNELISDSAKMKTFNEAEFAGDYQGIETLKVYDARAAAYTALKQEAAAKKAWKEAVAEGDRLKIKDEPSGQYLRFLYILRQAGENDRQAKFFEKWQKKAPESGEMQRRYAKFLFDTGQFKKSSELALQSVKNSYDQNEIFAATLYAKALAKQGKKEDARKFLMGYQARTDLPEKTQKEIGSALDSIK